MYAQIVVLTYQIPNVESYTYEIPKDLKIKIGHLVEVPFGKRIPQGIVIEIHDKKPSVKTKPITKNLYPVPILLPYQIKLLKWMGKYYLAPLVNCLDAMLPKIPKRLDDYKITQNSLSQSLVIVPTINLIPETMAKFPMAKNHIIYHSDQKMSTRFSAWIKILSGNTDFVFGSRATIFAPFPNLREIIIYNEHDGAYKDQRSPYFDTLTVIQKISDLTGAKIKIVDPSPKITTYFQMKNRIKKQTFNVNTIIISLIDEKHKGNFSPISSYVQNELSKKQKVLLFLNKKKESGNLFCKECKYNDYFESQPEMCPKCKSTEIYFNVLNVQSLRNEVKKYTKNPQIDIETASVFYAPILSKYDLVVYVQPDSLINRADYSSNEELYSQIVNLKKLLKNNGTLIVQSYNPNDSTQKIALSGDYNTFYESELKNRKIFSYPPSTLLIKLVLKGNNESKINSLAKKTVSDLKENLNNLPIEILGPFQSVFFSRAPSSNIIIKYKLSDYGLTSRQNAMEKIAHFLNQIDSKIMITVEPKSIN